MMILFGAAIISLLIGFCESSEEGIHLILGPICLVLFLIVFVYTLSLKVLTITDLNIRAKGKVGKEFVIERQRIVSFDEEHFKTVYRPRKEWDELVLYTDKGFVKITSFSYDDYEKIKEILTHDLPKRINKEINLKNKSLNEALIESRILITLGIAFALGPMLVVVDVLSHFFEGNTQIYRLHEASFYLLTLSFVGFAYAAYKRRRKYKSLLREMGVRAKF
ncbi:hypothetical protein [Emticicia soli]|uniref:hypothetical protein n=1 Tax=Emticicia soli TaxID=2027878 RepID=UPI0030EB6534